MASEPNIISAFTAQTRLYPDIMALTQGRITGGRLRTQTPEDPAGWVMPTYGIVYRTAPGPSYRRGRVPFRGRAIQVEWYGPDLRTSNVLYDTWYANFFPFQNNKAQGFIAANCAVASIEEMGSPDTRYDGETDWPRTIVSLFVRYSEIPTNVVFADAALSASAT